APQSPPDLVEHLVAQPPADGPANGPGGARNAAAGHGALAWSSRPDPRAAADADTLFRYPVAALQQHVLGAQHGGGLRHPGLLRALAPGGGGATGRRATAGPGRAL